jgi:hypothetical protein
MQQAAAVRTEQQICEPPRQPQKLARAQSGEPAPSPLTLASSPRLLNRPPVFMAIYPSNDALEVCNC